MATPHRYWRVYATGNAGGTNVQIDRLQLKSVAGGANLTVIGNGGTALSGAVYLSNPATYGPDGGFTNSGNQWVSVGGPPNWLGWDFGVGNSADIVELILKNGPAATWSVTSATLDWSDDGSSWTTKGYFSNPSTAANAESTITPLEPGNGNTALTSLPGTISSFGGGTAVNIPGFALSKLYGGAESIMSSSSATVVASMGGAFGNLTFSGPAVYANGHDSSGENDFTYTLPALTMSARGGANAALALLNPVLTITGTVTNWGAAEIVTASATLSASGTVSSTGQANLTFGPVNGGAYSLVGYSGAVLSVTLPSGTLTATGSGGSIGKVAITLPLFELSATGTVNGLSYAALTMPTPGLAPTARAALVMPFGVLTAIGSAVVAVSYEAYALNLNHIGENPVDELTRYTNYPFDRIVRYQNSYFGMNSTGLFLLEGTTDDATPIPWAVQTAFTDFDTPQNKTVEMAYFGGRFGPAATVSLLVSENNTKTYTYTTPRDTDAQNYRQPFGRGNKARYYALGANGSGTMTIDSITFNVATLARKV